MSATNIIDLRLNNPVFAEQLQVACAKVATSILAEASDVPLHTYRVEWARKTLASPAYGADLVGWAVVSNPTIAAASGSPLTIVDGDVEFAVSSVLNGFVAPNVVP